MNATMEMTPGTASGMPAPPAQHQYQQQIPGLIAMPPAMAELAERENWPYYRLMVGGHEEQVLPKERDADGSLKALRIKRGDVFRSPLNILAHNRGYEKFQLLYGGGQFQAGNNPNQFIWDMTRETLEQFNARIKQHLATGAGPVGVTQAVPQAMMPVPNMPEDYGKAVGPIVPPGAAPGQPQAGSQQPHVSNQAAPSLPPATQVDLAEYDDRKLRAIAAEEEVDVSKCRTKADLVGTLRKALGSRAK